MHQFSQHTRRVPMSTRLTVLWGSGFQPFGWLFFGFGMIFAVIFVGAADLAAVTTFRGALEQTSGTVSTSEKSGYSEGDSRRSGSGTPVYRHHYSFTVGSIAHQGVSYSKGRQLTPGQKVQIEFPAGQPDRSRIQGMRTKPFSAAVLFVLIFPVVGLALALPGLWAGRKNLALLKYGSLARGRLIAKTPTNTKVNKLPVYRLTFEYTDQFGQQHQVETKTHRPEKLEDDAEERLLYDSWRPQRAVFVDTLPGTPTLSAAGELSTARRGAFFGALIPPLLAALITLGAVIAKSL